MNVEISQVISSTNKHLWLCCCTNLEQRQSEISSLLPSSFGFNTGLGVFISYFLCKYNHPPTFFFMISCDNNSLTQRVINQKSWHFNYSKHTRDWGSSFLSRSTAVVPEAKVTSQTFHVGCWLSRRGNRINHRHAGRKRLSYVKLGYLLMRGTLSDSCLNPMFIQKPVKKIKVLHGF